LNIRVLFFASLRDAAGTAEKQMNISKGVTVAELWQQISADFELLPESVLCAVNQEYVETDYRLEEDDDEVAFFPPVTGG
jgi:molybdopterin synthase sulfur carrier subunit